MKYLALLVALTAAASAQQITNQLRIIPSPDRSSVGTIDFLEKSRVHLVNFSAPDILPANVHFRLPSADRVGCWASDGASNLSIGPCGGANSLSITPGNPLYLYSHFQDDDTVHGRLSWSSDGVNFKPINKVSSFLSPFGESRDPSITYFNGVWWIVTSPPGTNPTKIQLFKSTDLDTWTQTTIDINAAGLVPGSTNIFAPEFFVNPLDGKLYIIGAVSSDSTVTFYPYFWEFNDTTGLIVAQTAVTLSASAQNQTIDFYLYYDADVPVSTGVTAHTGTHKFYLFYVDTDHVGANFYQFISYAVSSSLMGPYVNVTPVSSPTAADHFGTTKFAEAPSVVILPNGHMRLYFDTWTDLFNNYGNVPRKYKPRYIDTDGAGPDPFAAVITAAADVNIGKAEHGTILRINDPVTAAPIFALSEKYRNQIGEVGSLVVGDTTSPGLFPLTVRVRGAHQFLQNPEPAEIGLQTGDGTFAVISSCGPGPYACPASSAGAARVVIAHSGVGLDGVVQLNNTNTDTGATSILFSNGIYKYGLDPKTGSALSSRALWSFGTMNPFFGLTPGNGNVANNWLFAYNRGLGASSGASLSVVRPSFNVDITGWTIGAGITAAQNTTIYRNLGPNPPVPPNGSMEISAGAGQVSQVIAGAVSGTVYTLSAYCRTDNVGIGAAACYLWADDGTGTPPASGNFNGTPLPINIGSAEWRQMSLDFTADATGNIRIFLGRSAGTGSIYWEDVSVEPKHIGSFPFGISPETGEVRANFGFTLGNGDATSLTHEDSVSLTSPLANTLAVGAGYLPLNKFDRGGILLSGYSDVSHDFTLNGTSVIAGETRKLQVHRIEPGFSNVPGVTTYTLPASGTADIFNDPTGPGNVTRIQVAMNNGASTATMIDTHIKVTVDSVVVMDVDLGTFFLIHGSAGGGTGSNLYAQFYANEMRAFTHFGDSVDMGVMRRIFIPYTTNCKIQLVNAGTSAPNLYTQVDFYHGAIPFSLTGTSRKVFHSVVTPITNTVAQFAGFDYLPLVTLAAGTTGVLESIDQVIYKVGAGILPSWLEGDPTITADGQVYQYGGTEDFFGGQFYWDTLPVRTTDYGVGHLGPANGNTLTSMYRYFRDPVVFTSTLKYTWFNGQVAQSAAPGTVFAGGLVIYYTSQ
jgi:Protein of unknown function (DUF2961)